MGLGKTVQAIAMLLSEREQFGKDAFGPTLVVCPMSVARQWVHEVERFAPGLRVHLHHGPERLTGAALIEAARASDVVVTSYDIVTRDVETLQQLEWDRLLLDEAQDVKNPQTRRARSLRLLRSRRRLAMTGTPIENHLGELWAIMDLLNPGLLGSREWFHRAFAEPIQLDDDQEALERLRGIVRPFILRRAKDDPEVELDLPPVTFEKDYCRLTLEQASLYQATVDMWLPRVEAHEDRFGRRGAVLAMLGQLKQVCNHPEMLLRQGGSLTGRSGKLDRMVELLRKVPAGDKALIFTQYTRFEALVPYLARAAREAGRVLPRLAQRNAARGAADGVRGGRVVRRARRLAARRRPRPQPAGGEPRLPLRPLVEPRGRAAGNRPRASSRPAQAGVRALADHARDARGADRLPARVEARARAEGDGRHVRGLARRSRPGRDPRRRLARARRLRGGRRMKNPWAVQLAARTQLGEADLSSRVSDLAVEPSLVTGQVDGEPASLSANPIPRGVWAEVDVTSRDLAQTLSHTWEWPLVPREIVKAGEHADVLLHAFAEAVEEEPELLLRWRGYDHIPVGGDPWRGGPLPSLPPAGRRPPESVPNRFGASGIRVGDEDLVEQLVRVYRAFSA